MKMFLRLKRLMLVLSMYAYFLLRTVNGVVVYEQDKEGHSSKHLEGGIRRVTSESLGHVTAFRLIDTETSLPIRTLMNSSVTYLSTFQARKFNIDAVVTNLTIGYVRFAFDSKVNFRTESQAPYALCGDNKGIYYTCSVLTIGNHTVTATPFTSNGVAGISQTVSFSIIDEPIVPVMTTSTPSKSPSTKPTGKSSLSSSEKNSVQPRISPSEKPSTEPSVSPSFLTTVANQKCSIPQFIDSSWSDFSPLYPIRVQETQGTMIGDDIIITSGFIRSFSNATNKTYARDVTGRYGNKWRRMDDLPVQYGITHGAVTVAGMKLYICGGFYGGNPGVHVPDCYVYDHSKLPGLGQQWTRLRSLPGEGTGGGGLIYDTVTNALFYAAGGTRNITNTTRDIYDINAFYKYELNNPNSGWIDMGPCPYNANHISTVTAYDKFGKERHYFLGGQIGKDECRSNLNKVYEWNAVTMQWIQRANIPFPRGHSPSSTKPISCGFIMAGGSVNVPKGCYMQTSDISYYDIETNVWTSIGNLSIPVNSPVCTIHDGYFYHVSDVVSNRRRIVVAE